MKQFTEDDPLITLFTPTFNRSNTLLKLYNSLQSQTYKNFEWIVVDDGSTDNTSFLFDKWLKDDNFFQISYKKVPNGGKHRAINIGLDLAKGELFFIVDSDDYLLVNSLKEVVCMYLPVRYDEIFCGISGLSVYQNLEFIGSTFDMKYNFVDCHYHERKRFNIDGDKSEVFKTDILKKFKFPEFENENFLTEAAVFIKMGFYYKIRYYNKKICVCEYLVDGISATLHLSYHKNPKGFAYLNKITKKYANVNYVEKLKIDYSYFFNFKKYIKLKNLYELMEVSLTRFLFIGFLFYIKRLLIKIKMK
jgi:glycosyltransferase involved in cell wall biosynthesis